MGSGDETNSAMAEHPPPYSSEERPSIPVKGGYQQVPSQPPNYGAAPSAPPSAQPYGATHHNTTVSHQLLGECSTLCGASLSWDIDEM